MTSTGLTGGNFGDELDDYEEGTYTPNTTAVTNIGGQSATYIKVGRIVSVYVRINPNSTDTVSTTTSTYGLVQNIPYAMADSYVVGAASLAAGSGHYGNFVGTFMQSGEIFIPWAWSGSSYHAGRLLCGATYVAAS